MSSAGQIVGGIVGAVVGFFVGGPAGALKGAYLGMTVGGIVDPPKGPVIRGPRLDDLSVQTATYGAFIPRVYGTVGIHGNVFWVQGDSLIEQKKVTESGGKGGSTQTTETFEYFATFAVGLCEGPIEGIRRIWIGGQLWYDAGATDRASVIATSEAAPKFTLYNGTDTQLADPLMQADKGAANVPAYRGLAYIVFDMLPLAKYSNSLMGAQVKVEIVGDGSSAPVLIDDYLIQGGGDSGYTFTLSGIPQNQPISGISYDSNGFAYYIARLVEDDTYPVVVKKIGDSVSLSALSDEDDWLLASGPLFPNNDYYEVLQTSLDTLQYAFSVSSGSSRYVVWGANGSVDGCLVSSSNIRSLAQQDNYIYFTYSTFIAAVGGDSGTGRLKSFSTLSVGSATASGCLVCNDGYAYLIHRGVTTGAVTITQYNGVVLVDTFTVTPSTIGEVLSSTAAACVENGRLYIAVDLGADVDLIIIDLAAKSIENELTLTCPAGGSITPSGANLVLRNNVAHLSNYASNTTPQSIRHRAWSLSSITSSLVPLSSIVSAECLKSKLLTASDIDVTELTDEVRGYRVGALGAIRSGLEPLRAAWPFDVVQSGYDIKFKKRGSASVATITAGELDAHAAGDDPGVGITDVREMDLILPYKVSVKYLDATREYELNEQYAERLNTDAVNESAIDLPIVFNASEAAGKAETLLYLYWLERYDVMLTLPPEYAHLEPGDVITVEATFAAYELRLISTHHLPDGRVDCRAKYNSASIYTSAAQGSEGESVGATLSLAGPTVYVLLDIPLLRDDDDTAGFPVSMTGYLSGWPGGVLFRSEDGGETWLDLAGFVSPGTVMGYATNSLSAHGGTVYDFASTLTVRLYQGALSSVTEAQLFAAQNWFAYGADGRWEIIAARTATLQGDGSYVLQDFLRGQLGTEWATGLHAANDSIVRLNAADLEFVSVNASTIGSERNYRGITVGMALDTDSNRAFTYRGVNLECLSPVHATGSRHPTTNDWTLTWVRRTRFAGWRDLVDAVLGEASESYEVEVFSSSAYTTLKRTLTSTTQSVTYTSADQVTDFGSNQATLYLKIYQLSATVGRGYPLTVSITR